MMLDEALEVVKERYGILDCYVNVAGKMIYVVKAEPELRAIPSVGLPGSGTGLFAHEVIELAQRAITIEALVRRKNPELFNEASASL